MSMKKQDFEENFFIRCQESSKLWHSLKPMFKNGEDAGGDILNHLN